MKSMYWRAVWDEAVPALDMQSRRRVVAQQVPSLRVH